MLSKEEELNDVRAGMCLQLWSPIVAACKSSTSKTRVAFMAAIVMTESVLTMHGYPLRFGGENFLGTLGEPGNGLHNASQTAGQFVTAVTVGNAHEVNSREKTIIAGLIDQLRIQGGFLPDQLSHLPYNTLREW